MAQLPTGRLRSRPAIPAVPTCPTRLFEAAVQVQLETVFSGRSDTAGLVLAIGGPDNFACEWAMGLADVERHVPMQPDSRVRIGSISKLLTAEAVARLVATGRLDPDAPIQRYVPTFAAHAHPITLRQLGGHLGGIRHYVAADRFNGAWGTFTESHPRHYANVSDALSLFKDDELIAFPGERFHYSSFGWTLISAAVEAVAQRPFLEQMQIDVFDRLGLHSTGADHPYQLVANRAVPYTAEEGRLLHAPFSDRSFIWAGGGLLSTAPDLVRFACSYLRSDFEARSSLLFTEQRTTSGVPTGHGVGWDLRLNRNFTVWRAELEDHGCAHDRHLATSLAQLEARMPPIIGHTGHAPGGTAFLAVAPDTGFAVALLANTAGAVEGWYFGVHLVALEALAAAATLIPRGSVISGGAEER